MATIAKIATTTTRIIAICPQTNERNCRHRYCSLLRCPRFTTSIVDVVAACDRDGRDDDVDVGHHSRDTIRAFSDHADDNDDADANEINDADAEN